MSNISQQPLANPLSISDLFLVYSSGNSDTRRASLTTLLALFTAQLATLLDSIPLFLPFIAGTANAIVATGPADVTIDSYDLGRRFSFIPTLSNTAATTLNIAGLGALAVHKDGIALVANNLLAGVPAEVMYDGTQFSLIK